MESSLWVYLFVTVLLGGGGAWMTGRAFALAWRGIAGLPFCLFLLALAVRFIHYSLFGGVLSPLSAGFALDCVTLAIAGGCGFRVARVARMVGCYPWLYERTGPFSFRERKRS